MRSALLLALVVASLALASCGKRGPPAPPGPPDQVIWPRVYPAQ